MITYTLYDMVLVRAAYLISRVFSTLYEQGWGWDLLETVVEYNPLIEPWPHVRGPWGSFLMWAMQLS